MCCSVGSGTLRDIRFVGEMRCDEGEFPGLVSKVKNGSDEEMVSILLSQAIRKSVNKIARAFA